ncbi:unnamed protein product [Symbiodinium pilosum]|uniref:Uncharacterized protein n=1 Tax=Symbiodinium pilosum TaxID=2952 RepID=A0A812YCD3_SYMPI|nr:unnamed protein product [Symbiodinium pilosum]
MQRPIILKTSLMSKGWGGEGTKAQQKPPLRRRKFSDEAVPEKQGQHAALAGWWLKQVTTSSRSFGSSNSPPRGQEKGGMGKGQGKAARAALHQLIKQQKQEEADSTNKVRQRREVQARSEQSAGLAEAQLLNFAKRKGANLPFVAAAKVLREPPSM